MKSKVCKAAFSGSEKEPTKFSSVITTSAIDRDQEVVVPSGMNSKDYERNPVLLYAHDPNKPIGKMLAMRRGESSIDADFVLAPRPESHEGEWLPDTIGSLMRFGALNGVSIQFAPIDGGMRKATKADAEKYGAGVKNVYSKWKLLEVSVVSIPANQDALISAVSKGICTRESLAALGMMTEKNCGVGAGGFESGNNCAGGGSSGDADLSARLDRISADHKDRASRLEAAHAESMAGKREKIRALEAEIASLRKDDMKARSAKPISNQTTKVRGQPLSDGMDAPKSHDIWLPKNPSRLNISEFDAAMTASGYSTVANRGAQGLTIRDSSGNETTVRMDQAVRMLYANSVHDDLNAIHVPTKRPRKQHTIAIVMPPIGTEEVAKIARLALARARGTFR